jgi:hypothetical protein
MLPARKRTDMRFRDYSLHRRYADIPHYGGGGLIDSLQDREVHKLPHASCHRGTLVDARLEARGIDQFLGRRDKGVIGRVHDAQRRPNHASVPPNHIGDRYPARDTMDSKLRRIYLRSRSGQPGRVIDFSLTH